MKPSSVTKDHSSLPSADERRRVAVTRRSTKGPLDADFDDPLAPSAVVQQPRVVPVSPSAASTPALQHQLQQPLTPARDLQPSPTPSSILDSRDKDFGFLLDANNFHPLPPHSVPQPFLAASRQPAPSASLRDLLDGGYYRHAAIAAAKALVTDTSPTDHALIFSLFYVRLACLTLLNQHDLAAAEGKLLGDLTGAFYRDSLTGEHMVPWELRVLAVRLVGLGYGDWRRGIMGYYELAREARIEASRCRDPDARQLWKSRLRDLAVRVANALIEMGECEGAARHLAALVRAESAVDASSTTPDTSPSPELARLRSMEALAWIKVGDIGAAKRCVAAPADGPPATDLLGALIAMAEADYAAALTVWDSLAATSAADPMIIQNRAVCLLYVGRISDARTLLEDLIDHGLDSASAFHALTFNLCTIYELCTEKSRERKLELVDKVVALQPSEMGWERQAADFKL